jgi:glycosyltransferase involved in cell wall biosynthesis
MEKGVNMVAIVMTFLNRHEELGKTLDSFRKYDPKGFFVVVVDDCSRQEIVLPELPFDVKVIKMQDKTWAIGVPAWNTGLLYALSKTPDIIIIQNAECLHHGDILSYANKVTEENYISFGCYSQAKGEEPGSVINPRGATFDGESAWYNHPEYRPVGYHFCSAISANNMKKINGFDERFSNGVGYDDDYLLHQIRCLGLKIEITTDPFVIHQWHEHTHYPGDEGTLFWKNEAIFRELCKDNNHKAQHLLTPDLI